MSIMAKLTKEDILKLARLSKLELTDEQVDKFKTEIESIVDYAEMLKAVDVSGLEPTNQVTGLVNVMREDEVQEYVSPDELLKNLPDKENNLIKVKRMIN